MGKAIKQAALRDILNDFEQNNISGTKVTELLNEIAENFAIGFVEWHWVNAYEYPNNTDEQLLEIYKKTL